MNLRAAYTAALVQLPPVVVALVGMLAGFFGAAIPALELGRLGVGAATVGDGVAWGTAATGLSLVVLALGLRVTLSWMTVGRTSQRVTAALMALSGVLGWAAVIAGALAGALIVGRAPWEQVAPELLITWQSGWVLLLAGLAGAGLLMLPMRQAREDDR